MIRPAGSGSRLRRFCGFDGVGEPDTTYDTPVRLKPDATYDGVAVAYCELVGAGFGGVIEAR